MSDTVDWLVPPPGESTSATWPEEGSVPFVEVRFTFLQLKKIDTVHSSAFIKLRLHSHWTDPRLIGYKGIDLPGSLWGPKFNLSNSLGNMKDSQDEFTLLDASTGRVRRVHTYEGDINNYMDLHVFPLDFDDIAINFTTMSRWESYDGKSRGKMVRGKSYRVCGVRNADEGHLFTMDMDTAHIPEFSLHGCSFQTKERPTSASGSERTEVNISLHVSRISMFYVFKVLFPLYMVTLLSCQVYMFNPSDLFPRVAVGATYFLACFALLYVVGSGLPKTDFLTKIDKVVVLATLVQVANCANTMFIFWYTDSDYIHPVHREDSSEVDEMQQNQDAALRINRVALLVNLSVFVLGNLVIFVPALMAKTRAESRLAQSWPRARPELLDRGTTSPTRSHNPMNENPKNENLLDADASVDTAPPTVDPTSRYFCLRELTEHGLMSEVDKHLKKV